MHGTSRHPSSGVSSKSGRLTIHPTRFAGPLMQLRPVRNHAGPSARRSVWSHSPGPRLVNCRPARLGCRTDARPPDGAALRARLRGALRIQTGPLSAHHDRVRPGRRRREWHSCRRSPLTETRPRVGRRCGRSAHQLLTSRPAGRVADAPPLRAGTHGSLQLRRPHARDRPDPAWSTSGTWRPSQIEPTSPTSAKGIALASPPS